MTEWADAERELDALAQGDRFSGSVLVTYGDTVLLERGIGVADRASATPVSPRTRFGTASLSKMFT